MKRLIAACLVLVLALSVLPAEALAAHSFVDYDRIHATTTKSAYKVTATFGPIVAEGNLRYTGSFTREEIEEEIEDVMRWMGVTDQDMRKAQEAIDRWEEDLKITEKDYWEILTNWAHMLGKEDTFKLASSLMELYKKSDVEDVTWNEAIQFFKDVGNYIDEKWMGELLDLLPWAEKNGIDWNEQYQDFADNLGDAAEDSESLFNLAQEWLAEQYKVGTLSGAAEEVAGTAAPSALAVWKIIYNSMEVFYEQWLKDKDRWKDRVDAVNGAALLKTFYDTVNNYLQARDPDNANWVLTVAGNGKRTFTFFGSEGNKQYYTMAITAAKAASSYNAYGYRGQGTSTPYGTYLGTGAIRLTHSLGGFNYNFWNLPIGQVPCKHWLDDMTATLILAGGAEIDVRGGATISRNFTAPDLEFTISGGYSYQYNSTIPATPGNRDVTAHIPLSAFEDELYTYSDHSFSMRQGIQNVQDDKVTALEYVTMALHSEMNGNNLQVICDDIDAYINIAGIEFADIRDGDISAANTWDYNIWANMDNGILLEIQMK